MEPKTIKFKTMFVASPWVTESLFKNKHILQQLSFSYVFLPHTLLPAIKPVFSCSILYLSPVRTAAALSPLRRPGEGVTGFSVYFHQIFINIFSISDIKKENDCCPTIYS